MRGRGVLTRLVQVGQVGGPREAGLGGRRVQPPLHHDALADVAQRVGDLARRGVALEHVAHVHPRGPVAGHVGKVPAHTGYSCTPAHLR